MKRYYAVRLSCNASLSFWWNTQTDRWTASHDMTS